MKVIVQQRCTGRVHTELTWESVDFKTRGVKSNTVTGVSTPTN